MSKILFLILSVGWVGPLSAKEPQSSAPSLNQLVEQFYFNQLLKSDPDPDSDCPRHPAACGQAVCDSLGSFGCDSNDELMSVLRACRGNFNGECIRTACTFAGPFECDSHDEVLRVARSCRGNLDGSCVEWVCRQLGSFGCDELDEVVAVARECGGGNE